MSAYGNLDKGIAGLKMGLDSRVETWIAQESIPFGYPVFGYVGDDREAWLFHNDVAKVVYSADFVTSNSIAFTINGTALSATVFATSHAATIAALVAKIDAVSGVEAILDTSDTDSRTILIRVKGATAAASSTVTLGASQATATITYGSGQVLIGVSQFTQKEPVSGVAQYVANDPVNVMVDGWILGVTQEAVEASAVPKIFNTTGANQGKFGGATGVSATGWLYKETVSAAGLAELKVGGPVRMTYADSF